MADETPQASYAAPSVAAVFERWVKEKKHKEIVEFEKGVLSTPLRKLTSANTVRMINVWDFIHDAIAGTGGYADGSYLIPHKREITPGGMLTDKFLERCENADYDDFAKTIAEGPINYIVQSKDQIKRDTDEQTLRDWWSNVDSRGTNVEDFILGYPADQARAYGTAWIFMDRDTNVSSKYDNETKAPYVYAVPTRNVVWWEFDDRDNLTALVVLEPRPSDGNDQSVPVRVWTPDAWAVYVPGEVKNPNGSTTTSWNILKSGVHTLGRIPVVRLFDEQPPPKKGMGSSVMLQVSRIARTIYNMESEARTIMRRTAFPFLAIPTKEAGSVSKVTIGESDALPFDKDGGEPKWVEPNLMSLEKYETRILTKKESAFSMAHMKTVTGSVKTTSGFHTEAEFDETNRSIGDFAASLEAAETDLAILYFAFLGVPTDQAIDKASVSYPREFKLRDVDALVDRTQKRLDMNLGEQDAFEAVRDLYAAIYPRRSQDEINKMAQDAAAAHAKAQVQAQAQQKQQATDRMKALLASGKGAPPNQPPGK